MESVICLSSCSVVLRYLVSSAGAIHGEFPLRQNNIYNYEQTLRGGQTHATRVTSLLQGKQQDTTASRGHAQN